MTPSTKRSATGPVEAWRSHSRTLLEPASSALLLVNNNSHGSALGRVNYGPVVGMGWIRSFGSVAMMVKLSTFLQSVLDHTFHNLAKAKGFILEMHRIGTLVDLSSLKNLFSSTQTRANNSEIFATA